MLEAVAEMEPQAPATEPAKAPILPRCPHCGEDPLKLNLMSQVFPGGAIASLMFCGNLDCRKLISAQIVGMAEQPGAIVRPHGVHGPRG